MVKQALFILNYNENIFSGLCLKIYHLRLGGCVHLVTGKRLMFGRWLERPFFDQPNTRQLKSHGSFALTQPKAELLSA